MLQERLFEELIPLIPVAADKQGADAGDALRALECKVEQIHTTLRKHLSKEEDQLLPLLLANFNTAEQVWSNPQRLSCFWPTCHRQSSATSQFLSRPQLAVNNTRA